MRTVRIWLSHPSHSNDAHTGIYFVDAIIKLNLIFLVVNRKKPAALMDWISALIQQGTLNLLEDSIVLIGIFF